MRESLLFHGILPVIPPRANRSDKTAKSFLGFLHLAAAKLWLPAFVNRA